MKFTPFTRSRDETPCEWLIEPLRSREGFFVRRTFGCWSCYLGEKNVLLYIPDKPRKDKEAEQILVPTDFVHHASLTAEFPALKPHRVLKKWLCVETSSEAFEKTALGIVRLILHGDPRLGVPGSIRSRARKNKKSFR